VIRKRKVRKRRLYFLLPPQTSTDAFAGERPPLKIARRIIAAGWRATLMRRRGELEEAAQQQQTAQRLQRQSSPAPR